LILDFRLPILDYGEKQMHKKLQIRFGVSVSDKRPCGRKAAPGLKWLGLLVLLFGWAGMAQAQQPEKIRHIGYLGNTATTSAIDIKPFRERLHELGYIDGQNFTIEYRYFDGKVERHPDLVAELVRLNCDVIVAIGNEAARAAKNATKETSIVMASTSDAVRSGLVASLARPGGNVTGLTSPGGELYGKRLELLKEIIPRLSRVGFLWSPTSPVAVDRLKETETVARYLSVEILSLEVKGSDDIEGAFQAATNKRAEALLVEWQRVFHR
jgi:ABC-type uncharacterized transport system substrate-binding protein